MRSDPKRIAARLQRLIADARKVSLVLVADAEGRGGVRIMTAEEERESDDLRDVGLRVPLQNACGGDMGDKSGGGKWM
jgi:hypothetical protein